MDFLSRIQSQMFTKEGKDKPVPKGGIERYFFLLVTHFWKFITLNLLFIVFSLPVITCPASICAINRVFIKLIIDGNCFVWQDFWAEWKASLARSIPIGILLSIGLFIGYYCISLGITNTGSIYGILFSAVGIFAALTSLSLGNWLFALIAMLPLSNRDIRKNAVALAVLEKKRSLAMIGIQLLSGFLVMVFFPVSLLFCVLILVSLVQYSICFLVNKPVQERIVKPYADHTKIAT